MARTARSALIAAALAQAATAAGVIEMPITFRNSYAMVSVEAGTPSEEHFLRFDTGSASTWIVDKQCAQGGCQNYSGFPRVGYNLSASSTGEQISPPATVDYLGGKIVGPGVRDTFHVGDNTWNQTFLLTNESSWAQLPGDGFMGLAFDTISDGKTHTVPETLLSEGALAAPRFGLYLGTELNDTQGQPGAGVLTLGGSHEDKYVDGDMTWLPAMKGGNPAEYQLWRAPLLKFSGTYNKNGSSQPVTRVRSWEGQWKASGVFDTGAGTISVPSLDVYLMYQSIGWDFAAIMSHDHIPKCTEFNSSWSVTFSFAGGDPDAADGPGKYRDVVLTGDQLARPGYANQDDACWPPFESGNQDGFFLFGTALLNQFYTVWDFGGSTPDKYQPRIGFGQLKKGYKPRI
ncbi:pepsinogen c [Apiospora arundinis]